MWRLVCCGYATKFTCNILRCDKLYRLQDNVTWKWNSRKKGDWVDAKFVPLVVEEHNRISLCAFPALICVVWFKTLLQNYCTRRTNYGQLRLRRNNETPIITAITEANTQFFKILCSQKPDLIVGFKNHRQPKLQNIAELMIKSVLFFRPRAQAALAPLAICTTPRFTLDVYRSCWLLCKYSNNLRIYSTLSLRHSMWYKLHATS